MKEGTIKCKSCGHSFYVGLFLYGFNSSRNSKDLNYYLGISKGETSKQIRFFLEDILDSFSRHFRVSYPLDCFFLFIALYTLFWILPNIFLGGFSKASRDFLVPFVMLLPGLMLFFLKRHCAMLRNILNFQGMPILLSEEYRNSSLGRQLEETLKGWIFGHPFQKIKPPTLSGLVAVAILLVWHANYVLNICSTFYETPYTGFPVSYTSYVTAIITTPFWVITYFTIGNIVWFFLATTVLVGLIAKNTPLKINPLKEMGGIEIFGKMVLSSAYTAAALGAALPFSMIWSSVQESYVLLTSVLLVSIFMFLIIFGFFYPLWPMHERLKYEKEKEINKILDKISLSSIEGKMDPEDALHTHLLLYASHRISSMVEWPFKTNTVIKLFSTVLFPLTSQIMNIMIFARYS